MEDLAAAVQVVGRLSVCEKVSVCGCYRFPLIRTHWSDLMSAYVCGSCLTIGEPNFLFCGALWMTRSDSARSDRLSLSLDLISVCVCGCVYPK